MNIAKFSLLLLVISSLAACGGGGSSASNSGGGTIIPPSRNANLKLATSGTPSAPLAGIGITVTLPDGVAPALNGDGSVAAEAAAVTGVAAPGTVLAPVYVSASGAAKGTLRLAMASSIAAGFGTGEFATVTLVVAAGSNPALSDFTISGVNPIDVSGNAATGLTATVTNLSLQTVQ
jgi:hypothetical protein